MNYPDASSPIRIVEANLSLRADQEAVLAMVDAYSRDAMGDGKPLDHDVERKLIHGLRRHPTTLIFLAFDGDQPVGAAVCFIGFSTFAAKPLINIHDLWFYRHLAVKALGDSCWRRSKLKQRKLVVVS